MNFVARGAAFLGILIIGLAVAWQARETLSQPARKGPIIVGTGAPSALAEGAGPPVSRQTAARGWAGYEEDYLRVLELIEGLPETLRTEIAHDPRGFNVRSEKLVNEIGLSGSVTARDVQRYRQSQAAEARATKLARYLALDLNGDGSLSEDEIDYAAWKAPVERPTEIRQFAAAADSDGDGTVTYQELVAAIDREMDAPNEGAAGGLPFNPMLFDMNGDGKVIHDELRIMGYLIAEEVNLSAWCDLPSPPPGAELIMVGTVGGYSLSNITLKGTHTLAEVATLAIEPGDTPLYIIVTVSEPVIWMVEGAVERIARLVVLPYTPSGLTKNRLTKQPSASELTGAAVAGLPADAVSFTAPGGCFLPFDRVNMRELIRARLRVSRLLEREVDHVFGLTNINVLHLPSGKAWTKRPVGFLGIRFVEPLEATGTDDPRVSLRPPQSAAPEATPPPIPREVRWPERALVKQDAEELLRWYPGGAIYLDPAELVAPGPVTEPKQLLGGIQVPPTVAELVAQGILRQLPSRAFVLEEPIARFPAGLEKANEVTFIIPKDVPIPRGDPGNATVILQDTGLCVHGPRCVR